MSTQVSYTTMKTEAMHQARMKITTSKKAGEEIEMLPELPYEVENKIKPQIPVAQTEMNTLPMPSKKSPHMVIQATRPKLAHAMANALHDEVQNGVPYTATNTKPLRLIWLTQHSMQAMMQLTQQKMHLRNVSFMPESLAFCSKYRMTARMN